MRRLSKRQIVMMHAQLVADTGGAQGIRDENLLESALAAPFQGFGDADAFPSLQQKAARLCLGLVMNHPFVDGNKRIGAHAMLTFLALNGIALSYRQEELSEVILRLAAGNIGYDQLLQWLIVHEQ
ncbi:MAG: type II toxin-antitoxin system death-on-curing family toxin [Oscillospiraceae bacterium]|jgi:death-on-curing protein|nr:type II toxin-antitoxin system death-on-curing family toxin [Oscillospiraceae bacterium]